MDSQFGFISDVRFFRDLDNIYRTEMFAAHILPYFHIAEYQIQKNLGVQGLVNKRRVGQFRTAALKRVDPVIQENGIEPVWKAALSCTGPFEIVDNNPGTLSFISGFFLQTPLVSNSAIGMECLDQLTKPSWFIPTLKPETREFLIDIVAIGLYQKLLEPEGVTSFNFRYEYLDLTKFVLRGYLSHYFSDIKKANEFVLTDSKQKPELYVSIAINPNRRTELIHRLHYFLFLYRSYSQKNQRALDHEGLSPCFILIRVPNLLLRPSSGV